MNDFIVALPPSDAGPPPLPKAEREYRAFLRLLPGLLQTHRGRYVAVHEEQVVGTGADQIELALRVWGQFGYVPIHVGLVADAPPSPSRRRLYLELHREQA